MFEKVVKFLEGKKGTIEKIAERLLEVELKMTEACEL